MALIRELADGQVSVKGPIVTINLRELPDGYSRDEELLLQIPVKIKLRARSAEALPQSAGQRSPQRLKKAQPGTEAAPLPLACALSARTASAAVPPPIRDPLETPTQPSLIRSPTLETPTPIPSEQQIDAEQASSSGGADPGPGEGVPSAASAIHETVLPSGPITVQDSPAHETAAVGARSSRVATLSDKVVRAHSAASGAPLPLARQSVEAKGGWPHGRV